MNDVLQPAEDVPEHTLQIANELFMRELDEIAGQVIEDNPDLEATS